MITTYEEYMKNFKNIMDDETGDIVKKPPRMINPATETMFKINANTREIIIPKQFENGVAVYKDYNSETLFFEIDRYFDDADLLHKKCVVQIINAEEVSAALPIDYQYNIPVNEGGDPNKIYLGWTLSEEVAAKEGAVTFSIRFFSLDEKNNQVIDYNWSTRPATIQIYKGLYFTPSSATIPTASKVEQLLDRISDMWSGGAPSFSYDDLTKTTLPTINGAPITSTLDIAPLILALVSGETSGTKFLTINDVLQELIDFDPKAGIYPVSNNALFTKFESIDIGMGDFEEKLSEIDNKIGDMTFIPIEIKEFTITPNNLDSDSVLAGNPALVENGSEVKFLTFNWKLSKKPDNIIIDNDRVPNSAAVGSFNKQNIDPPIIKTTTFTLEVKEKEGRDAISKTADLIFCDKAVWCVREAPESVDEINKNWLYNYKIGTKLTTEANFEIEANIGNNQYLYIALPKSIGTDFNFYFDGSGTPGGMDLVTTIEMTEIGTHKAPFNIYKSTNSGLGQRKIMIKNK